MKLTTKLFVMSCKTDDYFDISLTCSWEKEEHLIYFCMPNIHMCYTECVAVNKGKSALNGKYGHDMSRPSYTVDIGHSRALHIGHTFKINSWLHAKWPGLCIWSDQESSNSKNNKNIRCMRRKKPGKLWKGNWKKQKRGFMFVLLLWSGGDCS